MQPALKHTDHRPWPLPSGPWLMKQVWHELLFAHWTVPAEALRPLIPAELELDTFEGRAYVGVVPFRMSGVRMRWTPPLPWFSAFPELNVRTYVTRDGKPGVWFFSLDAAQPFAVISARLAHLPYFHARMRSRRSFDFVQDKLRTVVDYESVRIDPGAPPAEFAANYRAIGEVARAAPNSLEHWLAERYCLYAAGASGQLYRLEIHHPPWPLQPAGAQIHANTMTQQIGVALDGAPLLHYAHRLEVLFWPMRKLT